MPGSDSTSAAGHGRVLPWLLLALLVLGAGLGMRDPAPPDEPRFALAARQMVDSGDWLFPHRGSELYAHKPPPFMWMQAAGFVLTGSWRVAFLLPSLLAALGTLWLAWDLAGRLWDARARRYALLALLVTLQFALQARRAQIDAVLAFWTTLSLYGLLRYLLTGAHRRWWLIGWFAAGAGTITKGVGFLPLLVLPLCVWARRRGWSGLATQAPHRMDWVTGPAAFLVAVGLWLAPMLATVIVRDDPALHQYARELLFRQTAQRYADAWHHLRPPWYYLQAIATLWLPGVLLLPWLAPAWLRSLRARDARTGIFVGWSLLVLVFFSLSPGKREVYILPILPAMCIAAAAVLPEIVERRGVRIALLGYVLVLSIVALGIGIAGLTDDASWEARLIDERGLQDGLDAVFGWLAALGACGLLIAAALRARRAHLGVVAFTGVLWIVYGMGLLPAIDASSSARRLMADVDIAVGPDRELGMVGWREQHLLQARRPATDFGFERPLPEQWRLALRWMAAEPQRRVLFADASLVQACADHPGLQSIGSSNRRDWVVVDARALASPCVQRMLH